MADTGFLFPGTAVGDRSIGGGSVNWTDPDNIKADDGSNANTNTAVAFSNSHGLAATNFDFSGIPVGSTIDGIEAQCGDFKVDTTAATPRWGTTKLVLADDSDGSQAKHTAWTSINWTTSDVTDQVGGASDLWEETIGLSDVQDVDWGFFIGIAVTGDTNTTFDIDFMQMKVYYTTGPVITDVDGDETWDDGTAGLVITGTNFV